MRGPGLRLVLASVLLLGATGLWFRDNLYVLDILILILIWGLASTAWNLVGGFQNQLALGHSAYFAIGAYTSTLLYLNASLSPWLGVWLGALLGAALAAFIGWLCLRLRGAFYALATFALSQVVLIVALVWSSVTNGAEGLAIPYQPDPADWIFESRFAYFAIYLGFMLAYLVITLLFQRARIGLASAALSADEEAASALGVHVLRAKILAAALSGGLTAIAGTAYAQYVLFIYPQSVAGVQFSIQVALIATFGGVATLYGPLLGAILLIPLTAILTSALSGAATSGAPGVINMTYGLILMITFLYLPRGIGPTAISFVRRHGPGRRGPGWLSRAERADG